MNKMLMLLLAPLVISGAAIANTVTLNFSTLTDGYQYSYNVLGGDDWTEWVDETGFLSLNESILVDLAIASVNGPNSYSTATATRHTLHTTLQQNDMAVPGGLLSAGLSPSFSPNNGYLTAESEAGMLWMDYNNPAARDRGIVHLSVGITWGGWLLDEQNVHHGFSYSRSYGFFNSAMMTALDDLAVFDEAMFNELLSSPLTETWFSENVSEWTLYCAPGNACTPIEEWGYSLQGTFDFEMITAVPEPTGLMLLGIGGLVAGLGARRRHKKG